MILSRDEVNSKSELYELGRIGATPTKNSGRGHHEKADGIIYMDEDHTIPLFSVDVKEYGKSFAVTEKVWAKLNTDAKQNKAEPMFHLAIGELEPKTRLAVISEKMFLELLECYIEKYGPEYE